MAIERSSAELGKKVNIDVTTELLAVTNGGFMSLVTDKNGSRISPEICVGCPCSGRMKEVKLNNGEVAFVGCENGLIGVTGRMNRDAGGKIAQYSNCGVDPIADVARRGDELSRQIQEYATLPGRL